MNEALVDLLKQVAKYKVDGLVTLTQGVNTRVVPQPTDLCGFVGCDNRAACVVDGGGDPDNYRYACPRHVKDFISDGTEAVYPLIH